MKRVPKFVGIAIKRSLVHKLPILAKAAGFSSTMSLFPALIFMTALFFRSTLGRSLIEQLSTALAEVAPANVHELLTAFLVGGSAGSNYLIATTGFAAFWFAKDVNYILIEGFRRAYGLPERDAWWKDLAVASTLVFLTVVPFGVASVFLVFTRQIRDRLLPFLGIEGSIAGLIAVAGWVIAFATIVLIIATLYYVAPNRKQRWRLVFPGALVATALWFLSTSLFAWYVQHLARYTDLYGSASTVIVLLIWVYIANLVILVGCEYNAVRELRRGARG